MKHIYNKNNGECNSCRKYEIGEKECHRPVSWNILVYPDADYKSSGVFNTPICRNWEPKDETSIQ